MNRIIAALLLFCFPTLVQAEGLKLFPVWEQRKCPTEVFACYTFDQAKDILKLDLELQLRLQKCDACALDRKGLIEANEKFEQAIVLLEENTRILTTRLDEKQKAISDLSASIARLESHDIFGKALPWVITIVVVAAAAGFVGGYFLRTAF